MPAHLQAALTNLTRSISQSVLITAITRGTAKELEVEGKDFFEKHIDMRSESGA
jgi:hypothetical protein